ncbi:MAG: hypothetical protein AAF802_10690 [Planctomycetota bacterium]
MPEVDEFVQIIEHLQRLFEKLAIRGLRTCGPEQLAELRYLHEQLENLGATHLGHCMKELMDQIESGDRTAAASLLRAQSTLRTFERVLTLEVVEQRLANETAEGNE